MTPFTKTSRTNRCWRRWAFFTTVWFALGLLVAAALHDIVLPDYYEPHESGGPLHGADNDEPECDLCKLMHAPVLALGQLSLDIPPTPFIALATPRAICICCECEWRPWSQRDPPANSFA